MDGEKTKAKLNLSPHEIVKPGRRDGRCVAGLSTSAPRLGAARLRAR